MSKFSLTINSLSLAGKIAMLINAGHQIAYHMTADYILNNGVDYVVEMDGENVAGVIGLEKKGRLTELKHLCVHPSYRRKGLGIKLLSKGIEVASTDLVYGAVRSDNETNIRNNLRIGMKPVGKKAGRNGRCIIIFARRRNEPRIYREQTQ